MGRISTVISANKVEVAGIRRYVLDLQRLFDERSCGEESKEGESHGEGGGCCRRGVTQVELIQGDVVRVMTWQEWRG